jgi:hypothetical protein
MQLKCNVVPVVVNMTSITLRIQRPRTDGIHKILLSDAVDRKLRTGQHLR